QERGAAPAPPAPPERVRAAPDPRHALPARARRLDHRAGGRRGLSLLVRLPARRGWAEPAPALRGEPEGAGGAGEGAVLRRELRGPDGRGARGRAVGLSRS